jgi:hypothetical protein
MSLLEKLQSKWDGGDVTVATVATVDLFQKPSVAKVASVASSRDEGDAQPKPLTGFDPSHDGDPLLEILLDLGNEICDFWNDSEDARTEMRDDILSYPPHQREALMATLKGSLRAEKPRFKTQQEEARFTQRINIFFGRTDAKELAQRLMIRDREQDDRRLCLECRHFKPYRLECNNFEWAGFTQPKLGSNWIHLLQRCLGFEEIEI